jgi:membrane associated rhomboid family serine protease
MNKGIFTGTYYAKRLFYLNIIIFLLCFLITPLGNFVYGAFTLTQFWNPFQLVGHLFLHGSLQHLLGNMITLLFFAPVVEQSIGSRKFLLYYILMGIISGLVQFLLIPAGMLGVIGASGALFGVLVMAFMIQPSMKFFFGIPFKFVLYLIIAFELYSVFQPNDGVGHAAHLTGALVGIVLFTKEYGFNAKRWKRDYLFG